jgi:hypothetical protein
MQANQLALKNLITGEQVKGSMDEIAAIVANAQSK